MEPAPKPTENPDKKIVLQQPTVKEVDPPPVQQHLNCCGNCTGWQRQNAAAPFGQCLVAIRYLGAPMYTPDLANCSLSEEAKAKALQRR